MAITLGSKLDLLYNATEGENYVDSFRTFLAGADALIQASILSSTTTTPPTSPNQGDGYVIPTGSTGVWSGKATQLAVWQTSAASGADWQYFHPKVGWVVWDDNVGGSGAPGYVQFDGTNWSLPNRQPNTINFTAGLQVEGSQTLIRTNGTGDTIATTAGSIVADRVLTADSAGDILESAITIADVATQSSPNTFTQTQTLEAGLESNALVTLASTTPATNIANHDAPSFAMTGNAWDGSASITDEWTVEAVLGSGAEPSSTLTITHAGSTGTASVFIPSALTVTGTLATNFFLHTATSTPATSLANSNAPELQLTGSYWNGTAAANDNWTIEQTLGSGSNPTSTLQIIHNGSSGVATVSLPNLALTNGEIVTTASNSGSITPPTDVEGYIKINFNGSAIVIPYYMP